MLIFFLFLVFKLIILIFTVWIVRSIYRTIRVFRIVVQTISSDILIVVIFLLMICLIRRLNVNILLELNILNFFIRLFIFFSWLIGILIEISRLPYDFFESESELISGFMLELSSLVFVFLILVEYLEIFFFLFIFEIFFFSFNLVNFYIYFVLRILIFFLVFLRGYFIRYRFDKIILLI